MKPAGCEASVIKNCESLFLSHVDPTLRLMTVFEFPGKAQAIGGISDREVFDIIPWEVSSKLTEILVRAILAPSSY